MDTHSILVLDCGGDLAVTIAKKIRALHVYCEIQPCSTEYQVIQSKEPSGIIIAGTDPFCLQNLSFKDLCCPVLALGSSARMLAQKLGAQRETMQITGRASQIIFKDNPLFTGLSESSRYFERIDSYSFPEGIMSIAETEDGLSPAFCTVDERLFGLQFYPESNDPDGTTILSNFALQICKCDANWSAEFYVQREIQYLVDRIGNAEILVPVSGGLDSTVCAVLLKRAFGDQTHFVLVDTGLLRKNEAIRIQQEYQNTYHISLDILDISESTLRLLRDLTSPKEKRDCIYKAFQSAVINYASSYPAIKFLIDGANYSDFLQKPISVLNADGSDANLICIHPLRMLFKDEIRSVGEMLSLPESTIYRQSFPLIGLAARCIGFVTEKKLNMIRTADEILESEIAASLLTRQPAEYYTILTNLINEGAGKSSSYLCLIHSSMDPESSNPGIAKLPYDLLERVVQRITAQVPEIEHVFYDITSGPSKSAQWETERRNDL